MSEISPIQSNQALARIAARRAAEQSASGQPARGADSVELSDAARLMSKLSEVPEVRQDLINQVKTQIEAGTYETPEKIDQAINAMVDDLFA